MPFQDVKGQDRAVSFLKKELTSERVSHAYLFSGPQGSGKFLAARIFAKALNCGAEKRDACDACPSCLKIDKGSHPDFSVVRPQGSGGLIKIDQIKQVQSGVGLKPYEGRFKVVIINDGHLMNAEASNCLLKTLEEPPDNSVLILITPKPGKLFLTIRSRCRAVRFDGLSQAARVEILSKDPGMSKPDAVFASRLFNSGLPVSFASQSPQDDEEKDILTEEGILDFKNRVLDEFFSDDILLDEKSFVFSGPKQRIYLILSVLMSFFRDALVLKNGCSRDLLINADSELLISRARRLSRDRIENILRQIAESSFLIERNVAPKQVLNTLKMRFSEEMHA
ncbi:MAG: DNA polymerase III subunit delta' [Candidatus Omnitrophota bacterium]